jgi:nitroreductase
MISDLVKKNRSYRRFHEDKRLSIDLLRDLIDLARLSPSGANLQPLKYILSVDPNWNEKIFSTLSWAGYLSDWPGPVKGERPAAYIVILADTKIKKKIDCDHGIAAQSILLGATEKSFGGCIIGSIDKDKLISALSLNPDYEILLVLALGYPKETIILEEIKDDESIYYYRDENQNHHVPKRKLDDLILKSYSKPS